MITRARARAHEREEERECLHSRLRHKRDAKYVNEKANFDSRAFLIFEFIFANCVVSFIEKLSGITMFTSY